MAIDEATPTDKSLISWIKGRHSDVLATFLEKNAPSKTRRVPGGDGWIWVISKRRDLQGGKEPSKESLNKAQQTLDGLVTRLEEIESNTAIPKVKSKTSGPSKRMLKETAAQQCEKDLRQIGEEWPCGKWLFFEQADYVDRTFSKLAHSIIDGPLSRLPSATCHTIKVATADSLRGGSGRAGRGPQQLICLYFEDIWNSGHATEVLECLVKEHGEIPNSAKPDLYTMIGLDSNHPSRIRSTLYRPGELFNWERLREWQSASREVAGKKQEGSDKPAFHSPPGRQEPEERKSRKFGDDGKRVPVDPNEFWPTSESSKVGVDAQTPTTSTTRSERTLTDCASVPKRADGKSPIKSDAKSTHTGKVEVSAEGSETESESDIHPAKASKTPEQTPAHSSKPTSPHTPRRSNGLSEPIASLQREREARASRSPEEKIKTTLPVVMKSKKRDRFGRSDF